MTNRTMPAISTFRSAVRGFGAGAGVETFLRGAVVLGFPADLDRVVFGVVFLVRLGVLVVVPVFFLLPEVFLVLLVDVLRAIAILLTFP